MMWQKQNNNKKYLAEICPSSSVLWKVELASTDNGQLAEKISEKSVEAVWVLLIIYNKMGVKTNKPKMELLRKKEPEPKDLGNQTVHITKK